mmetsp:Transcript_92151/g.298372  ORF Transcript_92151/g.298372 Transcript_92151/m.298372 type:complete len:244 (+) Transcript_92151:368-1099(+)
MSPRLYSRRSPSCSSARQCSMGMPLICCRCSSLSPPRPTSARLLGPFSDARTLSSHSSSASSRLPNHRASPPAASSSSAALLSSSAAGRSRPWRESSHRHSSAPATQSSVPCLAAVRWMARKAWAAESSSAVTRSRQSTRCSGTGFTWRTTFSTCSTSCGVMPKKSGPCRCTTSMRRLSRRSRRSSAVRSWPLATASVPSQRRTGSTVEEWTTSMAACSVMPVATAHVMSFASATRTMASIVQ